MTFTHSLAGRNFQLVTHVGNQRLQVRSDLFNRIRSTIAGDDENLAEVVIKQHRHVMSSRQLVALPRALNRLGAEDLETRAVDVGEDVERSLVIADTRRPDALTVDAASFKAE